MKKNNKVVSLLMAASMLFGMSLPAVHAEDTEICSLQDFESVTTAEEAGWTWNNEEPTIEMSIGNNTGNSLTFNGNGAAAPEMIYNFTTTERFTVKMKLYMESDADTYIRFINSNNKYIDIMSCGWSQIIWQENRTNIGTYTTGWNDVAITFDPAQQSYSFTINDISVAETAITNSEFFNYDIAAFKVIKTGQAATVAIDDFSITAATASNVGLDWNGEASTLPANTAFYNGLTETYVTDAFGDTTKGSSLSIGTVADNSPMLQLNPTFENLTGNTAFSYSFDLGIDSFSASRTTDPSYYFQFFENTNLMGDGNYGFSIDENGLITFFGKATDTSLSAGDWHNIKYVMASNGANTKQNASLYIDGNYVTSATLNIWTTAAASKIDRLRFCNNSTSSTMYVDNVKLERLDTPMITSTDSTIASLINTSDYQIYGYAIPDMTVGDFTSKTTGAVVKKNGADAPADALLKDCDIYSTTANGELISWDNVQSVNNDIFNENFNSFTTGNVDANGDYYWQTYSDGKFLSAYPNGATVSVSGGFAEKTAEDMSIVMEGSNVTSAATPFIQLNNLSLGMVSTIDADIYVDGEQDAKIHNRAGYMLAEFLKDGSVTVCGQSTDFNWKDETKDSKWMNISICIDTIKTETTLLINNKIVDTVKVAYEMPECRFASFYDGTNQSGVFAIDNLHIYEGMPKDYAIGEIRGFSNGSASGKFDIGEYTVKCNVLSYAEELPVMLTIAAYDADGILKQVTVQDYNVSGSQTVEASINVESADGKLKAFVWNPKTLKSYVNCKTIKPKGDVTVKMFPGFTTKAVTIGFDDGLKEDIDVINVLDKYGAKATFNIVGSTLSTYFGTTDYASIADVYQNHEIVNHTYEHLPSFLMEGETSTDSHGSLLTGCTKEAAINDVLTNKTFLEDNLGVTTRGIVWPYKFPQDSRTDYAEIEQVLKDNGYVYARYSESGNFDLPTDMMKWAPTCHINTMALQAERFVNLDTSEEPKLFYFWGHSFEFENSDGVMDTTSLEEVLQTLSQADIWYATNGEVYDYVTALSKVTQNGDIITNASDMEVYLNVNGKNITLAAGEEYRIIEPPHIVCWGDSLTYGAESTNPATKSYPAVLANLSGAQVDNMGVPGETTTTIAARQGVLDIVLSNDITIPASGSVPIEFKASNGGKVAPRDVNICGWNPCSIDGVEGKLDVVIDTTVFPRVVKSATFTRSTAGESKTVAAGTQIKVAAQEVKGDINIIFSGTNGGWTANNLTVFDSSNNSDEIAEFVQLLKKQAQDSLNPDKYIVIGLTINDDDYWSMLDSAMQQEFGEHFFNLRKALANEQLLTAHGITPTADDTEYISRGAVPPSILAADGTHFNDAGYQIIAELLYEKLQQLGYVN